MWVVQFLTNCSVKESLFQWVVPEPYMQPTKMKQGPRMTRRRSQTPGPPPYIPSPPPKPSQPPSPYYQPPSPYTFPFAEHEIETQPPSPYTFPFAEHEITPPPSPYISPLILPQEEEEEEVEEEEERPGMLSSIFQRLGFGNEPQQYEEEEEEEELPW